MEKIFKKAIDFISYQKKGLREVFIKKYGIENYYHILNLGLIEETYAQGQPSWVRTQEVKKMRNFYV